MVKMADLAGTRYRSKWPEEESYHGNRNTPSLKNQPYYEAAAKLTVGGSFLMPEACSVRMYNLTRRTGFTLKQTLEIEGHSERMLRITRIR